MPERSYCVSIVMVLGHSHVALQLTVLEVQLPSRGSQDGFGERRRIKEPAGKSIVEVFMLALIGERLPAEGRPIVEYC